MRTVINLCLLNLAIADLAFLLTCPPFTAYQMHSGEWSLGDAACKVWHYLLNVTVYVTIYTLVLIAIIRYMAICHGLQTMQFRTKSNMIYSIAIIWIVFLLLNIPVIFVHGLTEYESMSICEIHSDIAGQKLYSTFFTFAYVLPLAVIATSSTAAIYHLKKHSPDSEQRQTFDNDSNEQASKILILVVVFFAVLWLPLHLHLLVAYFGHISTSQFYQSLSLVWHCMAYSNSCVNPIIYNFASKEFRDAFREKLCCKTAAATKESSGPTHGMRSSSRRPSRATMMEMQNTEEN